MKKILVMKIVLLFGAALIIIACSKSVGPSDSKVALDAKERWEQYLYGLISVDVLDINDKEVLSEDRVVYKIVMRFTRTNKAVHGRIGLRIINRMGGIGSEDSRFISKLLQSPAGTSEKVNEISKYRLRQGDWVIERN